MQIDTFRLRHMAKCVQNQPNGSAILDELFRRTSLSREVISLNKTVDILKEPEFITEACDILQDPVFAARAGLALRDGTSLTSYIAKHSRTLRAAIENSSRYYSVFDPAFSYSLKVSGNAASFELDCIDAEFCQFHRHKEFLLFAALSRVRFLTNTNFYPIEMRFDHEMKSAAKVIQKLAGCPVVFGVESIEILLPLSTLDLTIPTYDPSLQNHLMQYGERLLKETPDQEPTLEVKIKSILANSLPGRMVTAEEVASSLGMSKRTFARRLNQENSNFRKIVDEVRCDIAKVYLKDSFSISEIAFYLDYSDQAAFSTAFKRWMGCSPNEYRIKFGR